LWNSPQTWRTAAARAAGLGAHDHVMRGDLEGVEGAVEVDAQREAPCRG